MTIKLKNNNIKVNNEIIEDSTTLPLSNQILQDKLNDINIEDNTVEDSEYKNNDYIIKVESLESGDIRENIDVEDNINQSSNKLEKECKIILKDKDESIYSLKDFNNEFINKMSDDLIKEIDDIELYNLKKILNTNRQHEVEEYYWNLGGECELEGELSLVGMMIDKAEISYNDSILSIKIYRADY